MVPIVFVHEHEYVYEYAHPPVIAVTAAPFRVSPAEPVVHFKSNRLDPGMRRDDVISG